MIPDNPIDQLPEEIKVRVLIDKNDILIRAGDPEYSTPEMDKEILRVVKDGGRVKNVSYSDYKKMKLYEKVVPANN